MYEYKYLLNLLLDSEVNSKFILFSVGLSTLVFSLSLLLYVSVSSSLFSMGLLTSDFKL